MRTDSWSTIRNALPLILISLGANAAEPSPVEPTADLLEAGRRIYQEGVLPDGKALVALRAGGVTLTGDLAACANCHRRSGFGQVEGRSEVPSLAGDILFAPGRYHDKPPPRGKAAPGMTVVATRSDVRPAYDGLALARAMRDGIDPKGRTFDDLMPRYLLDEPAFEALHAYLRQLSVAPAPGVTPGALHLATVIAPGMSAQRRSAVVDILDAWLRQQRSNRRWVLHVWNLEGAPESWDAQLARRYREQPVFAMLSGLGGADWLPVHRFCERMQLPCVLPNLELSPDAEGDFYSLYYSRGMALEAGALGTYLREAEPRPRRVVQVHEDAAGEAAALALGSAMADSLPLEIRRLDPRAPDAALAGIAQDDALVLWLRAPRLEALLATADPAAKLPTLYLSAMLADPEVTVVPEVWRPRAAFVTVFDDPARIRGQAGLSLLPWLKDRGLKAGELRLQADTYGAAFFFSNALARMRGRMNRELLMETLERAVETRVAAPGYPGLSLGPNQRHAVKSGGILRYRPPGFRDLQPVGRRIVP